MAATGTPTPNIGLRRPQGTDPASVDDINYNSNLIDTKLGPVGNSSVQEQINSLNSKMANIETHPQYLSQEADWDTAIESYVDSLPNVNKCHISFVQRTAAGVVMCIIQKYIDSNYASAFTFGYWREPYVYIKDGGNWKVKKLTLNS